MSDDVEADFARLHGASQIGASGFNAAKTHPLFGAAHSFLLAHKYGQADPYTYMQNPGLRALDTRDAALAGLQNIGARFKSQNSAQVQAAGPTQTPTPNYNPATAQAIYHALTQPKVAASKKTTPPPSNHVG